MSIEDLGYEPESRIINVDNSMSVDDIQAEIDSIGKYIIYGTPPGDVSIDVVFADGTYTWDKPLWITGFDGGGQLRLRSNAMNTALHTGQSVHIDGSSNNSSLIVFEGFGSGQLRLVVLDLKMTVSSVSANNIPLIFNYTNAFVIKGCHLCGNSTNYGHALFSYSSKGILENNYVSNLYKGWYSFNNSSIVSKNNQAYGVTPKYGMWAGSAVIMKQGTQIAGSVSNEYAFWGGRIR